jgi:hypothetical protein
MLKHHEVEILLKAGHPKTEVARLAGVSLCSVKRIAEEAPVVHVDDAVEREKRRIGRPSIVEDFRKLVVKILQEKPELPSLEILRLVREAGYQGGKTALYALVASVRPKEIKPLIRFEGLPGEFSQHDFGEVDVAFLDGSTRRIHFFASRLKYSRLIRVSVVKDQTVESLVRNLAEHLAYDSGVTAAEMDVTARGKIVKDSSGNLALEVAPNRSFTLTSNELSKPLDSLVGSQTMVTIRGQLYKKPAGKKQKVDTSVPLKMTILEVEKKE